MKVWAAAVSSESGDHTVLVSLNEDGIYEQILEMARCEYGDDEYSRDLYDEHYADEYLTFEDFLVGRYSIDDEREIDL